MLTKGGWLRILSAALLFSVTPLTTPGTSAAQPAQAQDTGGQKEARKSGSGNKTKKPPEDKLTEDQAAARDLHPPKSSHKAGDKESGKAGAAKKSDQTEAKPAEKAKD